MAFARFMATFAGRALRIAFGLGLALFGILVVGQDTGWMLALAAAAPVLSGAFNVLLIAPLLNVPFLGRDVPVVAAPAH